jgi:hypothetical protein
MDNSGNGNLYIGSFDGRIHLYGAEWGAWRIDQNAWSFQGFGGLYNKWQYKRIQSDPERFGVVRYTDTDNNGFIDLIEYDLNGDSVFEHIASLRDLGINDEQTIIPIREMDYQAMNDLFLSVTANIWKRAEMAIIVAAGYGLNTSWYSFLKKPRSIHERYSHGYWLNYYIYRDIRYMLRKEGADEDVKMVDKAYFSGDWNIILRN